MSGQPFCRCTHTALAPNGDIYVSDGYGNAAVHKYDPAGRHLKSWGRPGTGQGEFNLPHNICCDGDGFVYVADRENHRVQVFDGEGRYQAQINNMHRPSGLAITPGPCPHCIVGELKAYQPVNRLTPNLGARISILDRKSGLVLAARSRRGRRHGRRAVRLAPCHRARFRGATCMSARSRPPIGPRSSRDAGAGGHPPIPEIRPRAGRGGLMRAALALAVLAALGSAPALAQTCRCFPPFAQGDIEREADVVVEGVVENVVRARRETQVTLRVVAMRKGPFMTSMVVVTPPTAATCGVHFDIAQRVILAAKRDGRFFRTNTCMNLGLAPAPFVPNR
ncbi:MAG: hypothetical protein QM722_01165 [Piscinibacter sp.]